MSCGSPPHANKGVVPGRDNSIGPQATTANQTGSNVARNNKGLPIKQYEPFFSATDDYETEAELVEMGVTPLVHYDPLGRAIRTDFPDGPLCTLAHLTQIVLPRRRAHAARARFRRSPVHPSPT